ncbi:MAG: C2 family cysteine protease [Planctomycetaceae bacterium]
MLNNSLRSRRNRNHVSTTHSAVSESLEPRLLLTVNTAPTVVEQAHLTSGSSVDGKTAMVSVLGSDDQGESNLKYLWQTVSAPAGGRITFRSNNSNAAKLNTLTFNRAGDYSVKVLIRDSAGLSTSSTLSIHVNQTQTSIAVTDAAARVIKSGATVSVATTSASLRATALDQFGVAMATQPVISWTSTSAPTGGSSTLTTSSNSVTSEFTKIGGYGLRAASGSQTSSLFVSVVPTLTQFGVTTVGGEEVSEASTVTVTSSTVQLNVAGFDQFGNRMTTLPSVKVTAPVLPSGGKFSGSVSRGIASLTFNKAGCWSVRFQGGAATLNLTADVVPTFTKIGVRTPTNTVVPVNGSVSVAGTAQHLTATALDQFGSPLAEQPEITWDSVTAPSGSSPDLSQTGNGLSLTADKAGVYALQAAAGGVSTNLSVSVSQVLTSLTFRKADGTAVNSGSTLTITGKDQQLTATGYDQFGNVMTTLPTITVKATTLPVGGKFTGSVSKGVMKLAFTTAGTYVVSATGGSATYSVSASVVPTFTSLTVRTPDNKIVPVNGSVASSGISQQLSATAMDQFGIPLASQPSVSWQSVTVPAGATPTLTQSGNGLSLGLNQPGTYALKAVSGTIASTLSVKVAQVLTTVTVRTSAGSTVNAGSTITVTGKDQLLNLSGFDQFGSAITTLPTVTLKATSLPVGGKFTGSVSKGVARLAFTTAGTYLVTAQGGAATFSFTVNVVSTFASLKVTTPDNKVVANNGSVAVTGTGQQLSVTALDQFGAVLAEQPSVTWQAVSVPTGAQSTLTQSDNSLDFSTDRGGSYVLKAVSGSIFSGLTLKVAQVLTTLTFKTSDGTSVTAGSTLSVSTKDQVLTAIGYDQFGNVISTLPTVTVKVTSAPLGGKLTGSVSKGLAKLAFTSAGTYGVTFVGGTTSFSLLADVVPTFTSLSVRTPDNKIVANNGIVTVAGTSQQFSATALDQFGKPLETQPDVTWQSVSSPAGATASLTPSGNDVSVSVDHAGTYSLLAVSGSLTSAVSLKVTQLLSQLSMKTSSGTTVNGGSTITVTSKTEQLTATGFDQFGDVMATLPTVTWKALSVPAGGSFSGSLSKGIVKLNFTRTGSYSLMATGGAASFALTASVVPTLTSLVATGADGKLLSSTGTTTVTGTGVTVNGRALDQFGQPLASQPTVSWSMTVQPAGSTPSISISGNTAAITFDKAGSWSLTGASGGKSIVLKFSVAQKLTSLQLTPGTLTVAYGTSQQFVAQAKDQFGNPLTQQPSLTWTATGGTITSKGLYVAGSNAGSFAVTVKTGTFIATSSVIVQAPTPPTGLVDPELTSLVNTYYADSQLSRTEVMDVLRSAGSDDGMIDATELADLRFLVSAGTLFVMPGYVQGLAQDVVNANPANLHYQGQTAGNLTAGSSSVLLNKLVDKWFLGTDLPQLIGSGISYQMSSGNLFNGNPSRSDARQGILGDCYFIAAVSAIADKNPNAVRNLFLDNGDGTYTVRFFASGSASYVTVNRQLPASASGTLAYSGYGLSLSASTTTLWIALAEKAYAQWNETGEEGRDGTNQYAGIEGGWMSYVNAQVLGYDSSNYSLTSGAQSTLNSAITGGKAVTIGTLTNASTGGLFGSHAYIVTAYNSSNGTYTLYNPWGMSHPTPLTYAQLQANCSMFTVTAATGAPPISASVSSAFPAPALFASAIGSDFRTGDSTSEPLVEETERAVVLDDSHCVSVEQPSSGLDEFLSAIPGARVRAQPSTQVQTPAVQDFGLLSDSDLIDLLMMDQNFNLLSC